MDRLGDSFDIRDGTQDIARVGANHKFGLLRHEFLQDVTVELRIQLVFSTPPL
jgi:hypothetical protein